MRKSALRSFLNWQTKRRSNCTQFQRLTWMITTSRRRSWKQSENFPMHYTRNSMGTSGNVFESLPAQETIAPSLPGIAMRHGEGLRREPQSSTIPTPRFSRHPDAWNCMRRTGGTYSQNCTMETPRYAVSELHVGKCPGPDDFQCWRVNFKTEVCVSTSSPELTMSWINEVEMAVFVIDFVT